MTSVALVMWPWNRDPVMKQRSISMERKSSIQKCKNGPKSQPDPLLQGPFRNGPTVGDFLVCCKAQFASSILSLPLVTWTPKKKTVNFTKKRVPGYPGGVGDFIYLGRDWSCSKHGLFVCLFVFFSFCWWSLNEENCPWIWWAYDKTRGVSPWLYYHHNSFDKDRHSGNYPKIVA